MNITIPNYEILNFQNERSAAFRNGGSKVYPQPLLQALSQLQVYKTMSTSELDKVLVENGFYANDVFEFLDR